MKKLFKKKFIAFLIHLLFSLVILGSLYNFVFYIWYPTPFFDIEGIQQIIIILTCIYLILGPFLIFILYTPGKKGLFFDIIIVILIQSSVFIYGSMIIYKERPAYICFSYDQFITVRFKKINASELKNKSLKSSIFSSPIVVTIKLPKKSSELIKIISDSTQKGKVVYEMEQYYQPFHEHFTSATKHTSGVPLNKIFEHYPEQVKQINTLQEEFKLKSGDLMFLPLKGSEKTIIAIINKQTGRVIGYLLISPLNLIS